MKPIASMAEIAELRPPAGLSRKAASSAAIAELLIDHFGARSLGKDRTFAIDCADGSNVHVQLRAEGAVVSAALTGDDEDDELLLEVAASVAELLQAATGWHVRSEHIYGFVPSGRCACTAELFEWQTQCGACRRPVPLPAEPSFPDEYEAPYQTLFTIEAPEEEDRSPWDGKAEPARIPELLALLRGRPDLRVEQASVAAAALVLRLSRKSRDRVLVSVRRDTIRLASPLRSDASPSPEALAAARELAEILQGATSWAVRPSLGAHFSPCGACPSCKRVVFRWQTRCARCGHRDLPIRRTESEEFARTFVALLEESGTLRLRDDEARRAVEERVARAFESRSPLASVVLELRGPGAELLDESAARRLDRSVRAELHPRLRAR